MTAPYIKQPASYFKTGSLSDYLGVPTTVLQGKNDKYSIPFSVMQADCGYFASVVSFLKGFATSPAALSFAQGKHWSPSKFVEDFPMFTNVATGDSAAIMAYISKYGLYSYYGFFSQGYNYELPNPVITAKFTNSILTGDNFSTHYYLAIYESATPLS